jgi:site-specific DNA-cytosine methylase
MHSPALRTGTGGSSTNVATTAAVRRLTPVECERLQGYPDNWTATSGGRPQSDSARYRQLGNSVAVPVFAWVASRIIAFESAELESQGWTVISPQAEDES